MQECLAVPWITAFCSYTKDRHVSTCQKASCTYVFLSVWTSPPFCRCEAEKSSKTWAAWALSSARGQLASCHCPLLTAACCLGCATHSLLNEAKGFVCFPAILLSRRLAQSPQIYFSWFLSSKPILNSLHYQSWNTAWKSVLCREKQATQMAFGNWIFEWILLSQRVTRNAK